jgi:hypothetical protein
MRWQSQGWVGISKRMKMLKEGIFFLFRSVLEQHQQRTQQKNAGWKSNVIQCFII